MFLQISLIVKIVQLFVLNKLYIIENLKSKINNKHQQQTVQRQVDKDNRWIGSGTQIDGFIF